MTSIDMAQFQISNEPWGYVVEVYWPDAFGNYHWHPLRNFGDRQGDAIDFRDIDCPTYEPKLIQTLIKMYDKQNKYKRLDGRRLYRQK